MTAIQRDFGSFENMKTQLSTASVGVQGSGWGWLGYNKQSKRLQVVACPNQDPLEATTGEYHLIVLRGSNRWQDCVESGALVIVVCNFGFITLLAFCQVSLS